MKKYFFVLAVIIGLIPSISNAYMMGGYNSNNQSWGMMQTVEGQALGGEVQVEMEKLMVKMMAGNLSDQESARLVELMNAYPAPYSMMMNRAMLGNYGSGGQMMGYGMMGGWYGGWNWLAALGFLNLLIWLIVGIFLAIWLWQKIKTK
ncbi:TPA: hypothetical protein DIC39_01675 [Patescibacteria group bacterium]|nr:hypothetical protein [Patescibacteria group bacterium]HCU47751.1 hypothetical protein [Patescibacteria group bacterium]